MTSYTELGLGYAPSDAVVNDLTVNSHALDADGNDQVTARVYRNGTSQATYGVRPLKIEVCLADVDDVDALAASVLEERARPDWTVTSCRLLYADVAGSVPDLLETVMVSRGGRWWTCLVVGIQLQIEPYRPGHLHDPKFVTLTLRKA